MKLLKVLGLSFIAIMLLAGCKSSDSEVDSSKQKDKIRIVTTFYPMYEFTKNIVGDKADVSLLIPSTIEPHDWEPTPKDIGNIQNADLFVFNSTEMETWVPNIKEAVSAADVKFVEASKGITLLEGIEEEDHEEEENDHEHEHEIDPHVWLSPVLAQEEVKSITDAIIKVDRDNEAYYKQNSEVYMEKLKELDNKYSTELNEKTTNKFITQHAAFAYLAKQYGLIQVPIAGLSPDQEPSASKLAELKGYVEEHKINIIYFGELTSSKVADTLANEVGAKTEVLSTLEGLSEADQKAGKDYISVMEENLSQLKKALFE